MTLREIIINAKTEERARIRDLLHTLDVYPGNHTAFGNHMNSQYLPRHKVFALLADEPVADTDDDTPV